MENNMHNKKKNKNYYKYHNNHNHYYNNKNNKKFYYYNKNKKHNKEDNIIENKEKDSNILLDNVIEDNNQIEQVQEINQVDLMQQESKQQVEEPQQVIRQVIKENSNDYEELEFTPIKKGERKSFTNKSNFFKYALGFVLLVGLVFGVSYSFFTYRKEDTRQGDISSGEVYVTLVEQAVNLTLNRMYPRTNEEARARIDNYIDFTVKAKNTSETKSIYYNININNGENVSGKTRINPQYVLVDLEEKINNTYTYIKQAVPLSSFNFSNEVKPNTTSEVTREFRIRLWVSDVIIISDTEAGATYTQSEFNNLYGTYNITVNSNDGAPTITGTEKVLAAIEAKQNAATNSCNPIWVDDNGTANDETDDIVYFSGSNDCIDFNYMWYSGKLWRITAIYPDESMKLVTEDSITTISWGQTTEYDGSWVYQWLNEDFYNTLINPENIIINNVTWNYSPDDSITYDTVYDGTSIPVRPETIETQKTKVAPIGLLNAYENYNAYRNSSYAYEGYNAYMYSSYIDYYLDNGYAWALITPYAVQPDDCDACILTVSDSGQLNYESIDYTEDGIRPSIVIKPELEFTGDGTKTSPYRIVGDKEDAVYNVSLLSSRSVGEYVKFDNDLYRIVDTNNGITKLNKIDYIRDTSNNNEVIKKRFAGSVYYGKSGNTASDDYWDYYLNNTWYNNISTNYKSMLVDGTYYLGLYPARQNYKVAVCKDATLDNVTTANCTRYTNNDADKIFTGKVGLPGVGEMFTSQIGSGYSTSSSMFLINPYATLSNLMIGDDNVMYNSGGSAATRAARPSITLKSGIKIISGTGYVGGNTNSPFEISE